VEGHPHHREHHHHYHHREEPSECPHSIRTLFETRQVDPGQPLQVEVSINADMYRPTRNDYLAVFQHDEQDVAKYVSYQYITASDKILSSPLKHKVFEETISAPSRPGLFEIRYVQYKATEALLCSQSFRIGPIVRMIAEELPSSSPSSGSTSFVVSVTIEKGHIDRDSAWLGLFASNQPSNKNYIESKYLKHFAPAEGIRNGVSIDVIFKTPRDFTRSYEIRLFPFHASTWEHSDRVTFQPNGMIDFVLLDTPSPSASSPSSSSASSSSSPSSGPIVFPSGSSKMRIKKGSTIKVGLNFRSFEPSSWDWVSLAQASLPPLQYTTYQYVPIDPRSESTALPITFKLPEEPGIYELRYFMDWSQPISRSPTFFVVE